MVSTNENSIKLWQIQNSLTLFFYLTEKVPFMLNNFILQTLWSVEILRSKSLIRFVKVMMLCSFVVVFETQYSFCLQILHY